MSYSRHGSEKVPTRENGISTETQLVWTFPSAFVGDCVVHRHGRFLRQSSVRYHVCAPSETAHGVTSFHHLYLLPPGERYERELASIARARHRHASQCAVVQTRRAPNTGLHRRSKNLMAKSAVEDSDVWAIMNLEYWSTQTRM